MTAHPDRPHPRAVGFAVALLLTVAALRWACGCTTLSPAAGAAIEGLDALACAGLALVPGPGAALSAVCVAEEPAVRAAVEGAVAAGHDGGAPLLHTATPALAAPSPPSLPPPRPGELATAYCARATGGSPLYAGRGRERRHVGCAPAGRVEVVQRGIDAMDRGADGVHTR